MSSKKAGSEGIGGIGFSGSPGGIKLILKMGGTSTPERSPSNSQFEVEDSQHSSFVQEHMKKTKKKDKKKKKDHKKHKHHHKDKKRGKELKKSAAESGILDASASASVDLVGSPDNINIKPENEEGQQNMSATSLMDCGEDSSSIQSPIDQSNKSSKQPPPKRSKFINKQPFQKLLDYLLKTLEKKDPQQFFAWPVTDKIAPGYSSIIKVPMDFCTMKSKIENETYNSLSELTEDFKLMCNNAMTYNQPDTIYYNAAKKLLQGGLKTLAPEKMKSLLPLIPSIRLLTEEHLGSPLFGESGTTESGDLSFSEDDTLDLVCMDPTKSEHYVPPHPNDPPDACGAFCEDLTTEEVLLQARLAAREAAHRLSTKKPNSKMGFIRQKPDGSTSLAILTPTTGVLPGTKELPISLGALSGKLTHGTTQVQSFKEDKRSLQRIPKPLSYGSFSSFAPTHDSTFANLNADETEMIGTTYGDDTAVQYAESMIEFAKGCDYTLHMVDEILDTITKGEHRKTVNLVEERKRIEAEETRLKAQQDELTSHLEMEWEGATSANTGGVNLESLKTLQDIGIDTRFLADFQPDNSVVGTKLTETAQLIGDLQKVQNDRLSQPPIPYPPYAPQPSEAEFGLATRITNNLTEMAMQLTPNDLVSPESIREVLGIDIESASYIPNTSA